MHDVLQVITTNDRRGAEVFAVDLGGALAALGRTVRTVALAPGVGGCGLEVTVLGARRLGVPTLRALRSEVRHARLVIAHGSTTLPACALATTATGVPFIYRNIGDPEHWGASALRRARSTVLLRRATAVVALTTMTAQRLSRMYHVPAEKLSAIPKGVPSERFARVDGAARARARSALGLPGQASVVLYMGSLSPEKSVVSAIDALSRLRDVTLLIVGDGPDRAALEQCAEQRAPGRVVFAGTTDEPAIALAAADVVVLPSLSEGLPGVLIEAGFSALPVVATDVGFVREIVVDGETGYLVRSRDPDTLGSALSRALRSPGLGDAARERCLERFELSSVAARWDELIEDTLVVHRSSEHR